MAQVQAALRKLDLPEEENLKQFAVLLDGLCAAQLQIKSLGGVTRTCLDDSNDADISVIYIFVYSSGTSTLIMG